MVHIKIRSIGLVLSGMQRLNPLIYDWTFWKYFDSHNAQPHRLPLESIHKKLGAGNQKQISNLRSFSQGLLQQQLHWWLQRGPAVGQCMVHGAVDGATMTQWPPPGLGGSKSTSCRTEQAARSAAFRWSWGKWAKKVTYSRSKISKIYGGMGWSKWLRLWEGDPFVHFLERLSASQCAVRLYCVTHDLMQSVLRFCSLSQGCSRETNVLYSKFEKLQTLDLEDLTRCVRLLPNSSCWAGNVEASLPLHEHVSDQWALVANRWAAEHWFHTMTTQWRYEGIYHSLSTWHWGLQMNQSTGLLFSRQEKRIAELQVGSLQ